MASSMVRYQDENLVVSSQVSTSSSAASQSSVKYPRAFSRPEAGAPQPTKTIKADPGDSVWVWTEIKAYAKDLSFLLEHTQIQPYHIN